jgi:hypothetical protein
MSSNVSHSNYHENENGYHFFIQNFNEEALLSSFGCIHSNLFPNQNNQKFGEDLNTIQSHLTNWSTNLRNGEEDKALNVMSCAVEAGMAIQQITSVLLNPENSLTQESMNQINQSVKRQV